jgi:hypothetical protein
MCFCFPRIGGLLFRNTGLLVVSRDDIGPLTNYCPHFAFCGGEDFLNNPSCRGCDTRESLIMKAVPQSAATCVHYYRGAVACRAGSYLCLL